MQECKKKIWPYTLSVKWNIVIYLIYSANNTQCIAEGAIKYTENKPCQSYTKDFDSLFFILKWFKKKKKKRQKKQKYP